MQLYPRRVQNLNTIVFVPTIISLVARGWESKSVEEQQAEALVPAGTRSHLTPEQILVEHRRQGLLLARQHVLQQLEMARSPRHHEQLQSALNDLNEQLAQLA